jgi:cardiolipin synthase
MPAQCFKSSYRDGSQSMQLMFLLSIAAARTSIRLETPYFVPDQLTMNTLLEARKRGVSIQIIVPGPVMDEQVVQKASRECWGDLLKGGIQIYEYQPTMFHCKLMIVDDYWTSVGSSNFDNRSFKLNEEANLNILDAEFACRHVRVFEEDLANSKEVTFEAWNNRSPLDKLAEGMAALLRSQL